MKLLTKAILNRLLTNGVLAAAGAAQAHRKPIVKLFNPTGAGTWLFTELDADGDTLFGLCDPGLGEPELGYASLAEISKFRGRFGLPIERDLHFKADKTLAEYSVAARAARRVVA